MKYLKYFLILFLILVSVILLDMKITRLYFLSNITTEIDFGGDYEESDEIEYTIQKNDLTADYKIRIKNKTWLPYYLLGYRNDEIFYQLNETDLFNLASRKRINYYRDTLNFHYGFDCGTGLGMFSINPKEVFEDTRSLEDLTNHFNLTDYLFRKDSIYYARINRKPIFKINETGELNWIIPNKNLLKEDSIKIQFALLYYSVITGKAKVTYSNELVLNYIELLERKLLR